MSQQKTALVLGATGGIGGAVARALQAAGWRVRALHRDPVRVSAALPDAQWIVGDAMEARDVTMAAEGADVILHGVNPPGYRRWAELVLPMIDNSVAAARSSGARLVLPGTIYNFGPDAWPTLTEEAPQNPVMEKGHIRVALEQRLQHLAEREGGRVLIVRAGDFFGPQAGNSWFAQGMVKAGQPVAAITLPGRPGVGHQWAYLPDVAATILALLDREPDLPAFARFHMEGHWDPDGTRMADAIRRALGRPNLRARHLNWTLLRLASPFVPLLRELVGMRYLWQQPLRMPNDRLVAFLGREPHTPLDQAVAATLAGLGCGEGQEAGGRHLLSGGGRLPA